jgi:hypothetical protein
MARRPTCRGIRRATVADSWCHSHRLCRTALHYNILVTPRRRFSPPSAFRCGTESAHAGRMILAREDVELLKQLKAAGERGRDVGELNIRATLDRLVKGGYLVGRPIDRDSVRYRITQRGQDAIVENDL